VPPACLLAHGWCRSPGAGAGAAGFRGGGAWRRHAGHTQLLRRWAHWRRATGWTIAIEPQRAPGDSSRSLCPSRGGGGSFHAQPGASSRPRVLRCWWRCGPPGSPRRRVCRAWSRPRNGPGWAVRIDDRSGRGGRRAYRRRLAAPLAQDARPLRLRIHSAGSRRPETQTPRRTRQGVDIQDTGPPS
jgi:hypothetical protein